ncbi:MAG: glycosyltransferase family 4 protein [Pseudomonadota bacterium]|nr:glycosyltransferase family 4 protein [Pseudomonadota bacterium]
MDYSRNKVNTKNKIKKASPVVLQLLPSLNTGGVERGTVDVTNALASAGWGALVVSNGGPMVPEIERAGGTHIKIPAQSKNPITMYRNIHRLINILLEYNVNILHARSRAPAWSALKAVQKVGVGFVTTFHGNYSANNQLKTNYNSIMAHGDRVIAISKFISDQLCDRYGVSTDKIRVIPRGVDTHYFDPSAVSAQRIIRLSKKWMLPDDASVIMLPGRLTRWKGQGVMIKALSLIKDLKNLRCIFVGSEQGHKRYGRELRSEIQKRGLSSNFLFTGHCSDMPAAFMLSDVVVSTSTEAEAFGRVIVEAQSMGRPVIATNHGAACETISSGNTGWLVPPNDEIALSSALIKALAMEPNSRKMIAQKSMKHARDHYTKEKMCESTIGVYKEILTDKMSHGG